MREDDFRTWLTAQGLAAGTLATRTSSLRRIERAEDVDLDEEFARDGLSGLRNRYSYSVSDERAGRANPSKIDIEPENLRKFLAFYRSGLNSYATFASGGVAPDTPQDISQAESDAIEAVVETAGKSFALERDLQAAIRSDIGQLEKGLEIADGGKEARVEAGLIDILAKDAGGNWTIIELKADVARSAVVAQTLAYMASVEAERGGTVRGIIVASDFEPRVELAVRAVPNLELRRYKYRFEFI